MISVINLEKSFGSLAVLRSLSCEFRPGRVTGLVGPNACGKTTLIKCILGLVVPDCGEVCLDGILIDSVRYRERLGYMPQQAEFPRNLTPIELFSLLSTVRRKDMLRQAELVERFELGSHLKKPIGKLSAGTRQKISAVAAFGFDPEVLILDEPTAGFDPLSCVTFKQVLSEARTRGATLLLVSHILSELGQLVDDVVFLLEGKVVFAGDARQISEEPGGFEQGIVRLLRTTAVSSEVQV